MWLGLVTSVENSFSRIFSLSRQKPWLFKNSWARHVSSHVDKSRDQELTRVPSAQTTAFHLFSFLLGFGRLLGDELGIWSIFPARIDGVRLRWGSPSNLNLLDRRNIVRLCSTCDSESVTFAVLLPTETVWLIASWLISLINASTMCLQSVVWIWEPVWFQYKYV